MSANNAGEDHRENQRGTTGREASLLDTAPVIYYVEKHPTYLELVTPVFNRIDAALLTAITSPVTLAECLVAPYRLGSCCPSAVKFN